MAAEGDSKDSRRNKAEGDAGIDPTLPVANRRRGLGPVAKYIAEYGGIRSALRESEGTGSADDAPELDASRVVTAQELLQWRNFEGKFPQSVVIYCNWKSSYKLKELYHYLQEREWVLQGELTRTHDKQRVLTELEAVESVLIWMITNLGNDED